MPLTTIETAPGHRVVVRTCDGCGSTHAPWGTGSLHEAIRTKDPSKVKCWCGPDGCRQAKEEKAA